MVVCPVASADVELVIALWWAVKYDEAVFLHVGVEAAEDSDVFVKNEGRATGVVFAAFSVDEFE